MSANRTPQPSDRLFILPDDASAQRTLSGAMQECVMSADEPLLVGTDKQRLFQMPPAASAAIRRVIVYLASKHGVAIESYFNPMTVSDVAELLDVNRDYVRKLIAAGELPATKTENGHSRVRVEDVIDLEDRIRGRSPNSSRR